MLLGIFVHSRNNHKLGPGCPLGKEISLQVMACLASASLDFVIYCSNGDKQPSGGDDQG